MTESTQCPACGVQLQHGDQFCQACGHQIAQTSGPKHQISDSSAHASTTTGKGIETGTLEKAVKKVSGTLMVVAFLFALSGVLFFTLLGKQLPNDVRMQLLVVNLMLAGVYVALSLWAKKNPLPASVVGLVLYLTVQLVNVVLDPATIFMGMFVKIFIVVVLISGVSASVKYRELQQTMGGE